LAVKEGGFTEGGHVSEHYIMLFAEAPLIQTYTPI